MWKLPSFQLNQYIPLWEVWSPTKWCTELWKWVNHLFFFVHISIFLLLFLPIFESKPYKFFCSINACAAIKSSLIRICRMSNGRCINCVQFLLFIHMLFVEPAHSVRLQCCNRISFSLCVCVFYSIYLSMHE